MAGPDHRADPSQHHCALGADHDRRGTPEHSPAQCRAAAGARRSKPCAVARPRLAQDRDRKRRRARAQRRAVPARPPDARPKSRRAVRLPRASGRQQQRADRLAGTRCAAKCGGAAARMILALLVALSAATAPPLDDASLRSQLDEAQRAGAAGRLDQARLMISKAIAAGASEADADRAIGNVAFDARKFGEALAAYRQVLTVTPKDGLILERAGI